MQGEMKDTGRTQFPPGAERLVDAEIICNGEKGGYLTMRNELQRFKVFLISSIIILLPSLCSGGDLYIWTDEQGVQHIEDAAPKISPKDKISVEKYDGENDASSAKGPPDIDKTLPPKAEREAAEQQAPEREGTGKGAEGEKGEGAAGEDNR